METQTKIIYGITKSSWGGAQKYVYDLAKYFVEKNNVMVVCGANEFGGSNIFTEKLQGIGVSSSELPELGRDVSILKDLKTFFTFARLFRKETPDIVHLSSSKMGLLGGLAARAAHVRLIIYTVHGLPFLEERPAWQNLLIKTATWITFLFAHKVIVLSKFEEIIVKKWWFVGSKIHQVYNAIEIPDFLSREFARTELSNLAGTDINEQTFLVGSIAELTANKGLLEFLPRLAEMKKRKELEGKSFIYIHFGTGELKQELIKRTEQLNMQKNIFWLGLVLDASKYLKALDLFTLPSKKEGFPYVLLEARHADITIDANKVGGVDELLLLPMDGLSLQVMLQKTSSIYEPETRAQI